MKFTAKAKIAMVIGAMVAAATLVIYFFGNMKAEKQTIDAIALLSVLFSELILFGSVTVLNLSKSYQDKVFVKSGVLTTAAFYWLIAGLFSILARKSYAENIGGFVTVHFVLFTITAIIFILFLTSYKTVSEKNKKSLEAEVILKKCENSVRLLSMNNGCAKYKDELNRMYEDIKYSDKSTAAAEDQAIWDKVSLLSEKLRAGDEEDERNIFSAIEGIRQMIRERNLAVRELKRGGA